MLISFYLNYLKYQKVVKNYKIYIIKDSKLTINS